MYFPRFVSSSSFLFVSLVLFLVMTLSLTDETFAIAAPAVREDDDDMEAHASESPEPSKEPGSDDDDEVCVDHAYVSARFPSSMLVHADKPLMADVFCVTAPTNLASSLPCMTRHHLLRVSGEDVSAGEFCTRTDVQCTNRKMLVNSVLSHAWTEELHGTDVSLTMLDARHPANLQFALHRAIALKRSAQNAVRAMLTPSSA